MANYLLPAMMREHNKCTCIPPELAVQTIEQAAGYRVTVESVGRSTTVVICMIATRGGRSVAEYRSEHHLSGEYGAGRFHVDARSTAADVANQQQSLTVSVVKHGLLIVSAVETTSRIDASSRRQNDTFSPYKAPPVLYSKFLLRSAV